MTSPPGVTAFSHLFLNRGPLSQGQDQQPIRRLRMCGSREKVAAETWGGCREERPVRAPELQRKLALSRLVIREAAKMPCPQHAFQGKQTFRSLLLN
ncbi:hypothetical protein TREES_T100001749 [Tupaia chinensis]|uniref:Uncharacterized protein n=1 Tax=Tupaia chinensis TaxID=246437 RepID=L9KKG7_TUPCH|nr:hypothetical protein TREES_T100001749 [Tupaia chinensis]